MCGKPGDLWSTPTAQPPQLTRSAIVAAAIELADSEGIEAVSIRRVAASLGVRPMSLYSHISRKDDLIDLMREEAHAEAVVPGELPSDWRHALRLIAYQTRHACLRHPWTLTVAGRRVLFGPNTLRHVDQSLAALSSLDVSSDVKVEILVAVDTFVLGHLSRELSELETQRHNGLSEAEWKAAVGGYLQDATASGEYPHLAAFGSDRLLNLTVIEDKRFAAGLDWLLAGIDATLGDSTLADSGRAGSGWPPP